MNETNKNNKINFEKFMKQPNVTATNNLRKVKRFLIKIMKQNEIKIK
jgi:uncharacterized protein YjbK